MALEPEVPTEFLQQCHGSRAPVSGRLRLDHEPTARAGSLSRSAAISSVPPPRRRSSSPIMTIFGASTPPTSSNRTSTSTGWACLRSATAFEAYCKVYTADLTPDRILEFLLLDEEFPHSLRFAIDSMQQALARDRPRLGRRAHRAAAAHCRQGAGRARLLLRRRDLRTRCRPLSLPHPAPAFGDSRHHVQLVHRLHNPVRPHRRQRLKTVAGCMFAVLSRSRSIH